MNDVARERRPSLPRRLASAVALGVAGGGAAGILALGVDLLLVRLMTASATPLIGRYVLAYLVVGAGLGLVVGLVSALVGRRPSAAWPAHASALGAWAFGLLYVLPIGERVYRQIYWRPPVQVWGAVVVVVAAYLALFFAYGLLARSDGDRWMPPPLAPFLAGACAALGLAVNRHLVDRALDPAALAADLAVVLSFAALAWLGGRRTWRAPVAAVAIAALVVAAVVALRPTPLPEPVPEDAEPVVEHGDIASRGDTAPPHLVFAVVDTLRQDLFHEALYGTPEGERFLRELGPAVHFTRATAAAPWTPPSMGTIFTGFYPQEHGFVSSSEDRRRWAYRRLSPDAPTLAERLGEHGYWSEALVSNPILHAGTGIDRGFDVYRVLSGLTVRLPLLTALSRMKWIKGEYYQPGASVVGLFERRFDRVLDACEATDRRAFFWVHLTDPHHPLHRHDTFEEDRAAVRDGDEMRALYRGEVRYTLDRLAELMQAIEAEGAAEETLVVLVSDHGEMLPGDRPGAERTKPLYGHGHVLYEPVLHVPLVIRPPAGELDASREIDALVSHADIHDTVLDLLGLDAPRIGRDRRSLAPFLRNGDATPRDWVLFSHTHHGPKRVRGLRIGGAKLIYSPEEDATELFDLGRDPEETKDVAAADPRTVELLRSRLHEVWQGLGTAQESGEVKLDEETRRQLEALGYI